MWALPSLSMLYEPVSQQPPQPQLHTSKCALLLVVCFGGCTAHYGARLLHAERIGVCTSRVEIRATCHNGHRHTERLLMPAKSDTRRVGFQLLPAMIWLCCDDPIRAVPAHQTHTRRRTPPPLPTRPHTHVLLFCF